MTNEELAIKCKTDKDYIPALWEAVHKLICQWATKYLPVSGATSQYEVDDLVQSGYFALLKAVNAYPECFF